jgi:hypothetical protein
VELTIVVIFDDHRILAASPFEELNAPGERKSHAGWKLVRRRYEDHFGVLRKASGIEAVAIDRDRQQPGTGSAEHFSYAVIVRLLDCHTVAAFYEHTSNEIERLLGAVDDNHLGRVADYRTGAAHMGADGFAQVEAPNRFAVVKLANWRHPRMPQQDAPPRPEGESFHVASPVRKVVAE